MCVSQLLGIDTAQCGLIEFEGGELAYITKRFDRLADGSKRHQEDLLQCCGEPAANKYSKTYEEAGKILNQAAGHKQSVTLDFVRRIIFAYTIGNNDLHLKNLSLQRLANNTSPYYDKLTPNYDCLFCEAFSEGISGSDFLALGLLHDANGGGEFFTQAYEHYGYYTGRDFIELGRRLGLRDKPVATFIEKVTANRKKIVDLIHHSFMPEEMTLRAAALIVERLGALVK